MSTQWIGKLMDDINRKHRREARENLHRAVVEMYQNSRSVGYDHEEAREVIRGVIGVQTPAMVPVAMLWVDREGKQ